MESFTWFGEVIRYAGLPAAIMIFYIWRDWKREKGMADVINTLTNKLIVITENSTEALAKNGILLGNLRVIRFSGSGLATKAVS